MNSREHAANSAGCGLIRHWTVADGEMCFLGECEAVKFELDVLHPCGRPAEEWSIDQRLQYVPDLRPAFAHRSSRAPGMLPARHRAIRVVVDADVFRPPPQEHREAVSHKDVDRRSQGGRRGISRPMGVRGQSNERVRAHFPAAHRGPLPLGKKCPESSASPLRARGGPRKPARVSWRIGATTNPLSSLGSTPAVRRAYFRTFTTK